MKKKFFAVLLTLSAVFSAVAESVVDFRTALVSAGFRPVISQPGHAFYGKDYSGQTHKLFDGYAWAADNSGAGGEIRWLDNLSKNAGTGGTGVWVQVGAPSSFRKQIVLRSYQFSRLSYWCNNTRRAPVEWTVYGVSPDGSWTELDHRDLGKDYWASYPNAATRTETNLFEIADAGQPFSTYRFVFTKSGHTDNQSMDGDYNIGLNEISLNVDLMDVGGPLEITSTFGDCYTVATDVFTPELGTPCSQMWVRVSAPEYVTSRGTTWRYRGYRLDRYVNEASWEPVKEVTDGTRSFVCTLTQERQRVVWLYEENDYPIDLGPFSMARLLRDYGYTPEEKVISGAIHGDWCRAYVFDGINFLADGYIGADPRWLGYITQGTSIQLKPPLRAIADDDEFFLARYRVYPLSLMGNEMKRAPIAWTMSVTNLTSADAWVELDTRTDIDWLSIPLKSRDRVVPTFTPPTGTTFRSIRFTPTDSYGYRTNVMEGTSGIDVGLMELELDVNIVNPKGTLRIFSGNGIRPDGFNPVPGSLVKEAATLTAPTVVTREDGLCLCRGWRLERFDEPSATWVEKETGTTLSYTFTPDPDVRYRLSWIMGDTRYLVTGNPENGTEKPSRCEPAREDNRYTLGETVTLTALPNTDDLTIGDGATNRFRSVFVRWTGDIDGLPIDPTSPTISFTVDRARVLVPLFRRDWLVYLYDLANEGKSGQEWRMTDGNWVIRCWFTGDGSLLCSKWISGFGALDFSTDIHRSDTGASVVIGAIAGNAFGNEKDFLQNLTPITDLVLPKTVRTIGGNAFRVNVMTNLVAECPELTEIGNAAFARNTKLDCVRLIAPKLTSLGTQYAFYGIPFRLTDFATWDLSSLREIPNYTFMVDWDVEPASYRKGGVLSFPRVTKIGEQAFCRFRVAAAFRFGDAEGGLVEIGKGAFTLTAATNYTLAARANLVVGENAFSELSGGGPDVVVFSAAAPADSAVLDQILYSNTSDHRARVWFSQARPFWRDYTVDVDNIEDADVKATAIRLGAIGAYRVPDGRYKAYVFAEKMPFDPQGSLFLLR